jgi:hypothetical protein
LVLDLLIAWDLQNCTPPQGAEAIVRIVESILTRELNRRGAL